MERLGFEMADINLCRPEFRLEDEAHRHQQEAFRKFEQVGQAELVRQRSVCVISPTYEDLQ